MMDTASDQPDWSRQVVNALPDMSWAALPQGARPWLWLSGAHSETLEQDLLKITKRFDYRWVWRDTPWEYGSPDYREGPLLVPLDEPLFTVALDHWLHQHAGLILLGPDHEASLIAHLQHLHQLTGADVSASMPRAPSKNSVKGCQRINYQSCSAPFSALSGAQVIRSRAIGCLPMPRYPL
jgi:hypothetical protein